MDSTPKFVDLLNSQQDSSLPDPFFFESTPNVDLQSSQVPLFGEDSNFGEEMPAEPRGRKKWTRDDDVVLMSAWLNTSKDPLVSNEQKSGAFWQRISAYVAANRKVAGGEVREPNHCKARWNRIHKLVSKFCGAYEAAKRERSSGQSDNDVLNMAHKIFENDNQFKFTLEHAWKELRYDQKWCELSNAKNDGISKRRRCEEGPQSSSSRSCTKEDAQATTRPAGVKATKGGGKKTHTVEGKALAEFQSMWSIREKDNATKERVLRMKMLDSLIAKQEALSEDEEALKKKLIADMLSN